MVEEVNRILNGMELNLEYKCLPKKYYYNQLDQNMECYFAYKLNLFLDAKILFYELKLIFANVSQVEYFWK